MMKDKLTSVIIFSIFLLLLSCDNINIIPTISFDTTFPKRQKNLSYILGDEFTFVSDVDTQTVKLSFDGKTKLNYLTNAESGDTLFHCWVSKFRGLYYFSEQVNDTAFWVYAVKIGDTEIKGWQSGWQQMLALQNEIDKGRFSELVKYKDTTNKVTRLTFDKNRLKNFYNAIIDSLPTAKIIHAVEDSKGINQTDTITPTTSNEILEQSSCIVKRAYPNPAFDNFNIEFNEEGNFKTEIYDIRGRNIKSFQVNSDRINISLEGIKYGSYYVRMTEQETNEKALIKLVVQSEK